MSELPERRGRPSALESSLGLLFAIWNGFVQWLIRLTGAAVWMWTASPCMASDPPLVLTLEQAVETALSSRGNLQVQIADRSVEEIEARSDQARAALLPHVGGEVVQRRQTSNLEAFGLSASGLFRPPKLVGPYSTFDARARLDQVLFNWSALLRFSGSRVLVESAEASGRHTRDEIAFLVSEAYVSALRDRTRLEAAEANRNLAEELLQLARDQKAAGTGTAIEVTRAQVKLAREEQAFLVAEQGYRTSLLLLNRLIGLPLEQAVILSTPLATPSEKSPEPALAEQRAFDNRSDLAAQERLITALQKEYDAIRAERIPSVVGFADYGTIGTGPDHTIPTWVYGVRVDLPIFDGGGREARRSEGRARLERERLVAEDLRKQISLEVELGLTALQIARGEIAVVESGLAQARRELEQARRRYRAGVTTSLEVTEAQANLKLAEDGRISALYRYNLARIQLADAMGVLRTTSAP